MRPIVNGLELEFAGRVHFLHLNAADGATGTQAFRQSRLSGHPSYLIFGPDGAERYRGVGIVSAETLRDSLRAALRGP